MTGAPVPGNSAKRNVQRTAPPGATAYSLPFMLDTYTVPSGPSAGEDLSVGPVWAVHSTSPSGEIADSRPVPLTT